MYLDPAIACPPASAPAAPPQSSPLVDQPNLRERRAPRVAFDLLVRFAWRGLRATALLKDLTRFGARIEGLDALRKGDCLTLLLPGLPATDATVAWAQGGAAGLLFEFPLDHADLTALIRDFATARPDFPLAPADGLRRAA